MNSSDIFAPILLKFSITIPNCFFLLSEFSLVQIYLNSIQKHFIGNNIFESQNQLSYKCVKSATLQSIQPYKNAETINAVSIHKK